MLLRNSHTIDREIEVLAAQLAILQRREDDFTRILKDMNRLLESVQAEKVALTSKMAELRRQKIPVNWLPSELLIQIFLICAGENAETSPLPYNPAPVLISHVCRAWRELALVTSQLWSFMSYRSTLFKPPPIEAFLDRSGRSELTFTFVSPLDEPVHDAPLLAASERNTTEGIIELLTPHFPRIRSITFECHFTTTISLVFRALCMRKFSKLQHLDLAVCSEDPGVNRPTLVPVDERLGADLTPTNSALADLRLEQVPLTRLPSYLLRTVKVLELSYSCRRRSAVRQSHFVPKMSRITQLLRNTPQLHELSMIGVTPVWDITSGTQANHQGVTSQETRVPTGAIELLELRRLAWQYIYPRDVYPFLSLLNAPQLERIDLLIAQPSSKRYDIPQLRGNHIGDQESFTQAEPLANVAAFHSLKELNVSCQNEDTPSSSLRQFLFPALEKLDIAFVGRHLRKEPGLPALSRLESIFRDPRLPHLTHLTLSHFDIPLGHGKAILAYIPSLVCLTLGGCTGVAAVLSALAESYGRVPSGQVRRATRACGVRICPRLEELVLWSCSDFQFETLYSVVYARSSLVDTSTPTPDAIGVDVASAVLGRQIRPLKKPRSVGASVSQHVDFGLYSGAISTLIPIQEALHPSSITCVHLEDCPPITEDQSLSLEELGAMVILK